MGIREPIAFLSSVRNDDEHDGGRITQLRERLEGEVRMQTGKPFPIFQDRNDLVWGQRWKERIDQSLNDVTFLIPVITPSFFESPACRSEFESFVLKESLLGTNQLILPIYYVSADQMDPRYKRGVDRIADILAERQWTDWRGFRFKPFADEVVASALAGLGSSIKGAIQELAAIREAAAKEPDLTLDAVSKAAALIRSEALSYDPTEIEEIRPFRSSRPSKRALSADHYHAYTKRYDEIVPAEELAEKSDITKLFGLLEDRAASLREEYAQEIEEISKELETWCHVEKPAVSILVDNSGSMRGAPVITTASWLNIMSSVLFANGIKFEINGFTTRTWKGGMSRELWIKDGKPNNPGRLNDLRFVIYKSFAEQSPSIQGLGLMLREGLLKENVDGEALAWAYNRLKGLENQKKVLIVLSDGSPVDDSTQSANGSLYLDKHLRDVIQYIKEENEVALSAVGIGHNVTGWYGDGSRTSVAPIVGLDMGRVLINALKHPTG